MSVPKCAAANCLASCQCPGTVRSANVLWICCECSAGVVAATRRTSVTRRLRRVIAAPHSEKSFANINRFAELWILSGYGLRIVRPTVEHDDAPDNNLILYCASPYESSAQIPRLPQR